MLIKKKEEPKSTVLGKQEPIPAESFVAADYAKSHDQADVSAESVLSGFPPDTKTKIDAAIARLATIEETLGKYKVDHGDYTEQRKILHEKILWSGGEVYDSKTGGKKWVPGLLANANNSKPASGEKPTFTILGGRGGSGKSSFKYDVYDPDKCIVIDADAIKEMMPEYEGWNAWQVHEESSDIVESALEFARINGLNVVLDATMKTAKTAIEKVQAFKDKGYRTEAHYMHLPRQEAAKRAVQRFLDGGEHGRLVPIDAVLKNTTNEAAFDQIKKMTDAWSFSDNNVPKGQKPILISKSDESGKNVLKTQYSFSTIEKSDSQVDDHTSAWKAAREWGNLSDHHKNLFQNEKDAIGDPSLDHQIAKDKDGNIIGLAVSRKLASGGVRVFALVTHPQHSSEGSASELLRKVIEQNKKNGGSGGVSLDAFPWSTGYYKHIGFAPKRQESPGRDLTLSPQDADTFLTNRSKKFKSKEDALAQSTGGVFAQGGKDSGNSTKETMTKSIGRRKILVVSSTFIKGLSCGK